MVPSPLVDLALREAELSRELLNYILRPVWIVLTFVTKYVHLNSVLPESLFLLGIFARGLFAFAEKCVNAIVEVFVIKSSQSEDIHCLFISI